MGLKILLKRDDIPSDAKEIISKESHKFECLQNELENKDEMHKLSIENFKRTERALRESEEKYRILVERANDGIAITQDYKLAFVNNRFANMLGYTVEELEKMPYNRTTHPEVTPEIDKRYQARIEGKNVPPIYETKLIRKNGTTIDVEFNSGVITYQGKPAAFTFIRDITERKRAEQALQENEEKYRSLVERAHDGITIVQDFNLAFINDQFAKMLGYTVEELENKPYNRVTHPEVTPEIDKRYQARLKGERVPSIYETKLRRKDGSTIEVEFNTGVISYQGKPATFTFIRDITERKKAEQALQESEERLRAFIYSATDPIDLWDSDLNLIECNQALIDNFPPGTKKEDLVGKNILEIIPDLKESKRYQKYLEVLRTGKPYYLESFESHPKFGQRFFSVQTFKVGDGLGMITRDITEQKLAEELSKELEQRRDNFVWMTSHELRTPLTVIIGYIDFLENMVNEIDYESRKKIFQTINNNLRRLERLTDEVSLLAQLERGIFKIDKKPFDFCSFFQEAVEPYKNLLGDQFEVIECQKDHLLIIEGDKSRLQQLLDNLVSNAMNHTHTDHRLIQLTLEVHPTMIQMSVTDNGAGIASDNLEKIFDQFVSVETEYYASGTGLGLYLCRKIAEGHEGIIKAQSNGLGHGATFIVTLPRKYSVVF